MTRNFTSRSLPWVAMLCLGALISPTHAQDAGRLEQTTLQVQVARAGHDWSDDRNDHGNTGGRNGNDIVNIGGNSILEKGRSADTVVSVFGSSTSDGDVSDSVVSVFGNTRVTGSVGDGAVAVVGNVSVNGRVSGDVVAVLGNVDLGPDAEVNGNVVAVGGLVKRDPAAVVHGGVQNVLGGLSNALDWIRPWLRHALIYGRPLAIAPGLEWAWGLALGFLALYLLLALLFHGAVDRCVETLETQPGRSLLAALLVVVGTPVVFITLCITVIGIAALPFLSLGLFCAGLFGRTVVLAALGRRVVKPGNSASIRTLLAVLIGGVIVLGLYLIPVLGLIIYTLVGIIGLGVVIYTLILAARGSRPAGAAAVAAAQAAPGPPPRSPEPHVEAPGAATSAATPPATHELDVGALPRAGFWIRMGALALDALLVGIVLGMLWHHSFRMELLTLATYGAIMWKVKGTTIGGIVFSLKVARIDGRAVDWSTAIVRALGCFLSLAVMGLGFLWIVFDDGKQAWHDKIAGTVVVRMPKGVSLL